MNVRFRVLLLAVSLAACAHNPSHPGSRNTPDRALLGDFEDDYSNRFTITAQEWFQPPHGRFHIVAWHTAEQYLIAQNHSANASDGGKWTRIDWMSFSGMEPFTWGFCLSAYAAPSAAAAESVRTAKRSTPKTGCNGFPFSRMRRLSSEGKTTSPRLP